MYQGAIDINAAEATDLHALREPRWAELVARFNAERDTRAAPGAKASQPDERRGRFASLEPGGVAGQSAPDMLAHPTDIPTDLA